MEPAPAADPEPAPPLRYTAALDAVRALAVVAVIGVHTHPRLAPGGAIGVDVFFVLSGFLITTLLLQELDRTDRIAFGRFYARRALRLVPALAVVLAAVTAYAVLIAQPSTRHDALREVVAAATYTRNWTGLWLHTPGPLLGHTWSLALEEQFYLLWPLVLTLALRRPERRRANELGLLTVFVAAAALATTLRALGVDGWSLLLDQRPDALLLGAATALARRRWGTTWRQRAATHHRALGAATAVALVTLAALAAIVWSLDAHHPGFPLAAAAAALLVATLVVADEGRATTVLHRAMNARPLTTLGRISYGVYLWQLPVLRWVDDRLPNRSAALRIPLALVGILAAATLSYVVVERPILRWKDRLGRTGERSPTRAGLATDVL